MEQRDIPFLSTAELSELIRQKELSPVEVTESYLERIDALNFKFNSVPYRLPRGGASSRPGGGAGL